MKVSVQWEPRDLWVGAYWDVTINSGEFGYYDGRWFDVWLCLVPCVPIHVEWYRRKAGTE